MSTTRYTIDMDKALEQVLTNLAAEKGVSKAEVIRRSLASYQFLTGQAPALSGKKISITDQQDKVLKDIVLP